MHCGSFERNVACIEHERCDASARAMSQYLRVGFGVHSWETHRCYVWLFVATYLQQFYLYFILFFLPAWIPIRYLWMFNVDGEPQSKIYIMSIEPHSVRIRRRCCVARFFDCIENICISFLLCMPWWLWPHKSLKYVRASQIKGWSRMWWQQSIIAAMLDHCEGAKNNEFHIYFATVRDCHMTAFTFGRNTKYKNGKWFGCRWSNSSIVVPRHCRPLSNHNNNKQ